MMDSIDSVLQRRWGQFAEEVRSLLRSPSHVLGVANPPKEPGLYLLLDEYTTIAYVGIAANCAIDFKSTFRDTKAMPFSVPWQIAIRTEWSGEHSSKQVLAQNGIWIAIRLDSLTWNVC